AVDVDAEIAPGIALRLTPPPGLDLSLFDNGLGDVLIGSVDLDGEYIGVEIIDGGNGLCLTLADGTRAGCNTIDVPGGEIQEAHFDAGDVIYGYSTGDKADLTVTLDGKPLDIATSDPVPYGDQMAWMWVTRLPAPESATHIVVTIATAPETP
ncbi:MAG TPA: hypothetical protein PLV68_20360, partial [Ilumatobacteraceae bacterium]|nr:hypothetical protein [Ilumatobacteraceae bacterium]